MNILLTGGTGFVGDELRSLLLKQGHHLTIITRSPKKYQDEFAKNLRFISWEDDLAGEMEQTDAVINLAGENIFGQRWTDTVKRKILNSRIDATRSLVDAMREAENKPSVLVSASGVNYYGNRGDDILDEDEPPANDFLAEVCEKWEMEANKASELGVRVAIARISIVLEKGGGALAKMIPPFQFFVGGPIGSGEQYMSWIHRTDLCRGLLFLAENEDAEGPFNMGSPNPVTMNEFANTLGSVMNRPTVFRVPKFALDIALGESAKPVTDSMRMQPKKLQVSGFEYHYEYLEEALADIF